MLASRSNHTDDAIRQAANPRLLWRERVQHRRIRRMKLDRPPTEAELRARMRPRQRRFWVSGAVILALLSLALQTPLLALAALLVVSLGIMPEIWQRVVLRGVRFERAFSPARVQFGEEARYIIQVENHKPLPVPWLEIEDELSAELLMPGAPLYASYKAERQLFITPMTLWGNERVTRRYRVIPLARGVWSFGPTYLRAGDPFGFLDDERLITQRGGARSLTVLPLIAPLERFGLPSRSPFGDAQTRQRLYEDPSQIAGARDYQPGDPLRRVHWKATAHHAALQSKVYPFTTTHTLALFLDIHTSASAAQGVNTALFELGIAAAASIADWAHRQHYATGLFTNGLPLSGAEEFATSFESVQAFMRVPPGTRPEHLAQLLVTLARLQPLFGGSIDRVIAREQHRLPPGATVLLITAAAALQPATVARLERLRGRGYSIALLLTGDGEADTGTLLTYRLGGEETWHELITFAKSRQQHGGAAPGGAGRGEIAPGRNSGDAAGGDGAAHPPARQPAFALG
jgi:uncharacterized protein (DUF58 family)